MPRSRQPDRGLFPVRVPRQVGARELLRIAVTLWLLATSSSRAGLGVAGDWPHPRGPSMDGHAAPDEIRLPWPGSGPRLLWRRELGQGFSGFIAVGGRVVTQVQDRSGQEVICLDLGTGEVVWRTRHAFPWELGGAYPGPYSTPTYAGGKVYVTDCYGVVSRMDMARGTIEWRADLAERFQMEIPGFGYASTPLIEAGTLFLPVGGKGASLVALNTTDGSVRWKSGDDPVSYASCFPIVVEGRRQLVTFLRNTLVAHDPDTGSELWRDDWPRGYTEHSTWPLYREPLLFCAAPFRHGARVLKLSYSEGRARADRVWASKEMSNDIFSSALVGRFLYGFDVHLQQAARFGETRGEFKCIELETGAVRWATNAVRHSNVLVSGDRLLLLDDRGTVVVIEANPQEFRELARAAILPSAHCWTMPLLVDGKLVVRNEEQTIACFDLGGAGSTNPVANVGAVGRDRPSRIGAWLQRYEHRSFWAPDMGSLGLWYGGSLACYALAWGAWRALDGRSLIGLWFCGVFFSALGTPVLTSATGRFTFTLPLGLYLFFALAIAPGMRQGPRAASRGRLSMALFLVVCGVYYVACRQWFLLSGWGFLAGFLPAIPLTIRVSRLASEEFKPSLHGWALSGFSVYFWTSALVTWWRTH